MDPTRPEPDPTTSIIYRSDAAVTARMAGHCDHAGNIFTRGVVAMMIAQGTIGDSLMDHGDQTVYIYDAMQMAYGDAELCADLN